MSRLCTGLFVPVLTSFFSLFLTYLLFTFLLSLSQFLLLIHKRMITMCYIMFSFLFFISASTQVYRLYFECYTMFYFYLFFYLFWYCILFSSLLLDCCDLRLHSGAVWLDKDQVHYLIVGFLLPWIRTVPSISPWWITYLLP